jgi:hypothetical protein
VTCVKWKLILVRLEIVLTMAQHRCTVWDERAIRSEIVLDTPMELLGDVGQIEARIGVFGDSVNLSAT